MHTRTCSYCRHETLLLIFDRRCFCNRLVFTGTCYFSFVFFKFVILFLSFAAENLKMLHEQDTENKLMHLLTGDRGPAVQAAAILALGTMSDYPVIRDNIVKHGKLSVISVSVVYENLSLAFVSLYFSFPLSC